MDAGRTCVFCSGRHCWCDVLHDRRQSCIRDDTRMIETTSMKTVLRPGLRQELRSSQHVQNRNRRNSSAGEFESRGIDFRAMSSAVSRHCWIEELLLQVCGRASFVPCGVEQRSVVLTHWREGSTAPTHQRYEGTQDF